ncbi:DNA methyltransferase, partial [Glaesserella parasuis]|nr:DNA methyltransferase [Glaesserella parasuis]
MLKKQTMRGGGKTHLNSNSYDDLQHLVVDTSLFSATFQSALISALSSSLGDFDSHINGTLIHSDNFQALNLLQARYREQVKCIYIDPPYNANSSEIIYKNTYKHSSWLALMHNRLFIGKQLLKNSGSQAVAIDEVEQEVLGQVLSQVFSNWTKACIPIIHNPRGQQGKNISYVHEYFFL